MNSSVEPATEWEQFGSIDPYWAVLTEDKFRASHISEQALSEFFASGEQHLTSVLQTITRAFDPRFSPKRALDFGCGVGRVLIPLARICDDVVGVDIAPAMLAEADANLRRRGVQAELVVGDDELSRVSGTFDFIHSYIVLQHIPAGRGERIARRLMQMLRPGGIAALHFTYANEISAPRKVFQWARLRAPAIGRLWNVLKKRPANTPYMEVYEYDLGRVLGLVESTGCGEMHALLTNHGGLKGVFLLCRKAGQQ